MVLNLSSKVEYYFLWNQNFDESSRVIPLKSIFEMDLVSFVVLLVEILSKNIS